MTTTPSTTELMSREDIIDRFRTNIAQEKRAKISAAQFQQLVAYFIEDVADLRGEEAIKARCQAELALLEEGYPQASVAKTRIPQYRKAIAAAITDGVLPMISGATYATREVQPDALTEYEITEHFAYTHITYSHETYQAIADETTQKNNERQDSLHPLGLEAYLEQIEALLQSEDWVDQAIAVAGATGRRFSEVIALGSVELVDGSPYELDFAGQLKKRDSVETGVKYRVNTLFPADQVLDVWTALRSHPEIVQLQDEVPRTINMRLNKKVNRRIKSIFQDTGLVPVLTGEEGVTVHNLRGIYGEIATHFFCPPIRTPHRFAQEQLGHVIRDEDLKQRANSNSTTHYFRYYLVNSEGQQIGGRGIKLGVPVETVETTVATTTEPSAASSGDQTLQAQVAALSAELERLREQLNTVTAPAPQAPPAPAPEPEPEPESEPEPTVAITEGDEASLLQATLQETRDSNQRLADMIAQQTQAFQEQNQQIIQLLQDNGTPDMETAIANVLGKVSQSLLSGASGDGTVAPPAKTPVPVKAEGATPSPTPSAEAEMEEAEEVASPMVQESQSPLPPDLIDEELRALPSDQLQNVHTHGVAAERLRRAYEALKAYNDVPNRPLHEKWQINQSILCQLTGSNVPAARKFCAAYKEDMKQHNQSHGIPNRHNSVHTRRRESVKDFVQW